MSHNLAMDEKTGEAALYLLKEKAWHGLGQVVTEAKNSDEVIKIAHLDWTVSKVPNTVTLPKKGLIECGSFSICRDDNDAVLHPTALSRYTPVQNEEAFKYMDGLVRFAGDITYETAGALGEGERTFVTAKLPGYIKIEGTKDIIEKYLIWSNSHAGGTLDIFFTDIRVVCNNTLSASYKDVKSGVSLKHTQTILNRIKESGALLKLIRDYNDDFGRMLNQLAKYKVDEKKASFLLNELFMSPDEMKQLAAGELSTKKKNIMSRVQESLHTAPGQDMHQGTALWIYNGVTSYLQNVQTYKNADRKMAGLNFGGVEAGITQKAFSTLMSLMQ